MLHEPMREEPMLQEPMLQEPRRELEVVNWPTEWQSGGEKFAGGACDLTKSTNPHLYDVLM